MRVIGVTGGVGSGKSEVLRLLKEEFGARLFIADDIAHEVMEPGGEACRRIEEAFGAEYLKPDGSVDRQKMASLIFKDAKALETMNSIVHPAVWKRIENGIQTAPERLVVVEAALFDEEHNRLFDEVWYIYTSRENRISRLMAGRGYSREKPERLVVVEAALFDEEHNRLFDEVWYIYTSRENRISRLMAGRGYSREKCLDIMSSQKSEEEFQAMADRVIDNNQTVEDVKRQIEFILNEKLKEEIQA